MADEANIRSSLQIVSGNLEYSSKPTAFKADVAGEKGPVPGAVQATLAGVNVDFGELTTPALCRIQNLDATNYIEVGIWDPEGSTFYPMLELLPGESFAVRLCRDLNREYGTGTGTTGVNTNRLRIKADTAACNVLVEAFEL